MTSLRQDFREASRWGKVGLIALISVSSAVILPLLYALAGLFIFMLTGVAPPGIIYEGGNTDPRVEEVYMGNDLYKICDGTTLVYTKSVGGTSAVENSPECTP